MTPPTQNYPVSRHPDLSILQPTTPLDSSQQYHHSAGPSSFGSSGNHGYTGSSTHTVATSLDLQWQKDLSVESPLAVKSTSQELQAFSDNGVTAGFGSHLSPSQDETISQLCPRCSASADASPGEYLKRHDHSIPLLGPGPEEVESRIRRKPEWTLLKYDCGACANAWQQYRFHLCSREWKKDGTYTVDALLTDLSKLEGLFEPSPNSNSTIPQSSTGQAGSAVFSQTQQTLSTYRQAQEGNGPRFASPGSGEHRYDHYSSFTSLNQILRDAPDVVAPNVGFRQFGTSTGGYDYTNHHGPSQAATEPIAGSSTAFGDPPHAPYPHTYAGNEPLYSPLAKEFDDDDDDDEDHEEVPTSKRPRQTRRMNHDQYRATRKNGSCIYSRQRKVKCECLHQNGVKCEEWYQKQKGRRQAASGVTARGPSAEAEEEQYIDWDGDAGGSSSAMQFLSRPPPRSVRSKSEIESGRSQSRHEGQF